MGAIKAINVLWMRPMRRCICAVANENLTHWINCRKTLFFFRWPNLLHMSWLLSGGGKREYNECAEAQLNFHTNNNNNNEDHTKRAKSEHFYVSNGEIYLSSPQFHAEIIDIVSVCFWMRVFTFRSFRPMIVDGSLTIN